MPIQDFAAFKKLAPQHSLLKDNKLFIIEDNMQKIEAMKKSFE